MNYASPLLTDLYQLNMMQAYLEEGQAETAVFEFYVRKLSSRRGFLLAAGLEQVLGFLENLRFEPREIEWLRDTGRFDGTFIDYVRGFRFSGDVHAMAEGTAFFGNEPILRVTAPLPQAQLVETRIINILHFQSLIASKAARIVLAAPGKLLVDFGLRRAHGAEAGIWAARASYLAGFDGTATVLAEKLYGIPSFGTMAHSYIEAHDEEIVAFENFARARPENVTFLLDTYDSEAAAKKVVALARRLRERGITVRGVRLDSGDLIALSKSVRDILDEGGLPNVTIFASGGLDEYSIADMLRAGAPIDGFGVGTSLTTSSDLPALDCAYKLQEYAGLPCRKHSPGKATWPGRKQVWRRYDNEGRMSGDIVSLESETQQGEPLLHQVMRGGSPLEAPPPLDRIRKHAAQELQRLPHSVRGLAPDAAYPVGLSEGLARLAAEVDARLVGKAELDDHEQPHNWST